MTDSFTQNSTNTPCLLACLLLLPPSARLTQLLPIISPYFRTPERIHQSQKSKKEKTTAQNTRYTPCQHHHLHPPSTLNTTLHSLPLLQTTFPSFSLFYTTTTTKKGKRPIRLPATPQTQGMQHVLRTKPSLQLPSQEMRVFLRS